MKNQTLILLVSIAAILAIAFALFEAGKARSLESAPLALRQRQDDLQRQIREAKRAQDRAHSVTKPTQPPAKVAEIKPTVAASPASASDSAPGSTERRIAINPSLRSRYLQLYKAGLNDEWGLFVASLKMSPDQAEKFRDLMVQRENNNFEVEAAAQAQGLDTSSPAMLALDDQLDRANKAAIADLLGQQGYKEWVQYHHEEAVLPVLGDLATDAQLAEVPLSLAQATQMAALLAASSAKNENNAAIKGTIDWEAAAAKSSTILSAQQMPVFTLLQERSQTEQQYKQLLNTIISGKSGP